MGFLTGFAFALLYIIAGLPIARWADIGSRRSILALGAAVWSAMTVASGMARNFTELALARVGVGIGEAAGTPPSHSLIADYFPPHRRSFALSIYSLGNYLGLSIAYIGGGWVSDHYGWRAAFIIVGIPGLLLALLVRLTVREPKRGATERVAVAPDEQAPPLSEVLGFLVRQRSYMWINVGGAFAASLGYGFGIWSATFFRRVHEMSASEVGSWIGVLAAVGGASGTLLGGLISDRLILRDRRWLLWIPVLACFVNVPVNLAFVLSEKTLSIALFLPHALIHALLIAPMFAAMQAVAKPRMRATGVAIHLFFTSLFGLGLGPLVVGMMNDHFAKTHGDLGIRYSLVAVSLTGIVAGFCYLLAARTLPDDLDAAQPTGPDRP